MKQSRLFASILILGAVAAICLCKLPSENFQSSNQVTLAGFFSPVDTVKPKAPLTGPGKMGQVPATAQTPAPAVKNAQLKVNEEVHEFGKIEQNTIQTTTFILGNTGTDTLEIFSANPSCGCTASFPGKKRIPPGDTSQLKISFDPHNKAEGDMTKTITVVSNSKVDPQKILRIHGTIYKSKLAHTGGMMHLDGVFQGNCASCHVDKGKGELGAKLYEADCAICHGSKVDNKPGPDITAEAMMSHDAKSWKHIISEGIDNSNMPAFALKHKGPLNDEEIASLVDYLGAFKKNLVREKQMKSSVGGAQGSSQMK